MEEIRLYLRRILFMIQKELIATLKDKKSRLVLLMPVLVQTLAFGYVATYNMVTPIKNMPPALQIFTYINPMRFAIDSVRRIYLEGAGLSLISHNYIPLLLIAAVAMPLAAWMFRHKLV